MKQTLKLLIAVAALTLAKGASAADSAADASVKPVAYWTMDQIADGVLQDQIGLHHAKIPKLFGLKDKMTGEILPDFTPTTEPGVKGNALALEREQQGFLKVAASKQFDFSNGMTVSAWVKIKNARAQMVILSCAKDISHPAGGWCLTYSYGNVFFKAVETTGNPVTVVSPRNSVPAGAWVHIAAVADATALRVYLNGVQVASEPFAGPIRMADTALSIGNHATIEGWRHAECPAFGGLMDEVKIFEAPLSAADVRAESHRALPGNK